MYYRLAHCGLVDLRSLDLAWFVWNRDMEHISCLTLPRPRGTLSERWRSRRLKRNKPLPGKASFGIRVFAGHLSRGRIEASLLTLKRRCVDEMARSCGCICGVRRTLLVRSRVESLTADTESVGDGNVGGKTCFVGETRSEGFVRGWRHSDCLRRFVEHWSAMKLGTHLVFVCVVKRFLWKKKKEMKLIDCSASEIMIGTNIFSLGLLVLKEVLRAPYDSFDGRFQWLNTLQWQ